MLNYSCDLLEDFDQNFQYDIELLNNVLDMTGVNNFDALQKLDPGYICDIAQPFLMCFVAPRALYRQSRRG
ncbi:MAG: hypothetical protein ACI9SC_000821 [Gammaproteobacteria bacterium]|jgi:hypothetical protein